MVAQIIEVIRKIYFTLSYDRRSFCIRLQQTGDVAVLMR